MKEERNFRSGGTKFIWLCGNYWESAKILNVKKRNQYQNICLNPNYGSISHDDKTNPVLNIQWPSSELSSGIQTLINVLVWEVGLVYPDGRYFLLRYVQESGEHPQGCRVLLVSLKTNQENSKDSTLDVLWLCSCSKKLLFKMQICVKINHWFIPLFFFLMGMERGATLLYSTTKMPE